MKISKIGITASHNQYDSKLYFADQLATSLQKLGITVEMMHPKNGFISTEDERSMRAFKPDFTLSFNATVPDEQGLYIWDYRRIPHLQVLVDPAFHILGQKQSPYLFYSSVDREDVRWLRENGLSKIFFWPHAVEENPPQKENAKRHLEVVFLGTCTDYKGLEQHWKDRLNRDEILVLEQAIARMWQAPVCSLAQALVEAQKGVKADYKTLNFKALFFYLDHYVRGKDRVELIRSIKDAEVHVFGEPAWINPSRNSSWKDYVEDLPNVFLHQPVTYEESFFILQQSKICLNSSPFFKHGSHERILNGLACGAVPLTTHNGFIDEYFLPSIDLLSYPTGKWDQVNDQVKSLLSNEALRLEIAQRGRAKVLQEHTWDVRARQLLEVAPIYLGL